MTIKNAHAFQTVNKLINRENLHLSDGAFHSESGVIDDAYRCTIAIICKTSDGQAIGFTYRSGDKKLKNKTYLNQSSLEYARSYFAKKLGLTQRYF